MRGIVGGARGRAGRIALRSPRVGRSLHGPRRAPQSEVGSLVLRGLLVGSGRFSLGWRWSGFGAGRGLCAIGSFVIEPSKKTDSHGANYRRALALRRGTLGRRRRRLNKGERDARTQSCRQRDKRCHAPQLRRPLARHARLTRRRRRRLPPAISCSPRKKRPPSQSRAGLADYETPDGQQQGKRVSAHHS